MRDHKAITTKADKPQAHYEKASDIAADDSLSSEEKKRALDTWEQDARQLLTASNEGMPGRDEGISPDDAPKLGEVIRAKAVIDQKPKPKSAHLLQVVRGKALVAPMALGAISSPREPRAKRAQDPAIAASPCGGEAMLPAARSSND